LREVSRYVPTLFGETFHRLALVVDRSAGKIIPYVGGQRASDNLPSGRLWIARRTGYRDARRERQAAEPHGAVDEFRIGCRALSPIEIAAIAVR
jgi:hypothetical protein